VPEFLEITVDKFVFKVATDRLYRPDGVWAKLEGEGRVRVGISDFVQQHSGDLTFAEVRPAGTMFDAGGEVAVIETVKATVGILAPASGTVDEVNPTLGEQPEIVNQDPYGAGWLVLIKAGKWEQEKGALLQPAEYLARVKDEAEKEVGGQ